MSPRRSITVYIDYKSPYAYLAIAPAWELERDFPVQLDWRPYILDIPSYLGSAQVDDHGQVLQEDRNAHQWRRVRYSYMDCRRQARKQGLVIRGTQKIWDSTLAAAGMLHAKESGTTVFRRYNDMIYDRFWRRALDIESPMVIEAVLAEAGASPGFQPRTEELRQAVHDISRAAEDMGVFGVPTFAVDGEIFWGREHLSDIRAMLAQGAAAGPAGNTSSGHD